MGLRDQNPMIDADLELIITAFEEVMVKSRDTDSVLVPFRRQLTAIANYPKSVINSIDGVPLPSEVEENSTANQSNEANLSNYSSASVPAVTSSPELTNGNPNVPVEDGDDNEEWIEKVKDWAADCIPCTGQFSRTLSSINADFFADIGDKWDLTLNETWNKLKDFENFIDNVDVDVLNAFCDLGSALKGQCIPDIKKMKFILNMMLGRMEFEFSLDLGILDSFLMSALSPIFNELAANLDLIGDLAIKPIRCVLDYIQYQINNAPRLADEARSTVVDPIVKQLYEERSRISIALRSNKTELSRNVQSKSGVRSESDLVAERSRLEEQYRQSLERASQQLKPALERARNAYEQTQDSLNFLDKFKEYLTQGTNFLENKKDWLLGLIEEFIKEGLDKWNDNMTFARGKNDLLNMMAVINAMIDAAKSGDISCGPESGGLSEEDVLRIMIYWQHPSESLEIIVEDGNIITRRGPIKPSAKEKADPNSGRGIVVGVDGPDSTSYSTGSSSGTSSDGTLSNVVVSRPISSCLKKITTDEADRIDHWIRQLEQGV